mgnify:CR=1 FL=1
MMITGLMFRDGVISGSNNIANNRQAVDALNIFPVPDGDTGTNMSMTIGAAAKEMAVLPENCTVEEASSRCASALLRGARGNSGVILSLIFRGFSKALRGMEEADGAAVAAAFRKGVDAAYKAVMKPTEGTILTVIRKAAEAAEQIAASNNDAWAVCCAAMAAAEEALAKTPEQLPVLKKAGVVDAGGQGLVLIFQGMGAVLEKGTVVQPIAGSAVTPVQTPDKSTVAAASGEIEFGYCSEFLIEKDRHAPQQDPLRLRAYLESIGDCVVVVDDSDIIKVHVHSNCPGDVIQAALKYGQLINIKIDNMRYQHRNAEEGVKQGDTPPQPTVVQPENDYGFVAVAAGEGLKSVFTGRILLNYFGETMEHDWANGNIDEINELSARISQALDDLADILDDTGSALDALDALLDTLEKVRKDLTGGNDAAEDFQKALTNLRDARDAARETHKAVTSAAKDVLDAIISGKDPQEALDHLKDVLGNYSTALRLVGTALEQMRQALNALPADISRLKKALEDLGDVENAAHKALNRLDQVVRGLEELTRKQADKPEIKIDPIGSDLTV